MKLAGLRYYWSWVREANGAEVLNYLPVMVAGIAGEAFTGV